MVDFFKKIIRFLNDNNIAYMLSGSVAMSVYVLPRATRDFDFVVSLSDTDVDKITEHFKEGYYCDEDAVKDAIKKKSMFNIIDFHSGFKADFVVLKHEAFRRAEFERRSKVMFFDVSIFIVRAEDLLLSKLIWIQELQSNIQMEDIKSLNQLHDLDRDYVKSWIAKLKLNTFELL